MYASFLSFSILGLLYVPHVLGKKVKLKVTGREEGREIGHDCQLVGQMFNVLVS
jgi:hypothetical protein